VALGSASPCHVPRDFLIDWLIVRVHARVLVPPNLYIYTCIPYTILILTYTHIHTTHGRAAIRLAAARVYSSDEIRTAALGAGWRHSRHDLAQQMHIVVSATRRSSGIAPRACVRVYARVLVPPNIYIHTYRYPRKSKQLIYTRYNKPSAAPPLPADAPIHTHTTHGRAAVRLAAARV